MIRGMADPAKKRAMTRSLIASLALGVFVGLFFGERTSILRPVGAIYVGLIQMTILPYIMVSLIRGVGSLSMREARQMLGWGGAALATLWAASLIVIFIFAQAFPAREGGSFFDPSIVSEGVASVLDRAVPSNLFQAMAENQIPVVVLFCLLVGGALVGMRNKDNLIGLLDVAAEALGRVNGFLVRFTAVAVFSMTAVAAGTLTPQEFGQIGGYVLIATAASLVLFFGVLPALVVSLTPFGYRDVRPVCCSASATRKTPIRRRQPRCCTPSGTRFPTRASCSPCCSCPSSHGSSCGRSIGWTIPGCSARGWPDRSAVR